MADLGLILLSLLILTVLGVILESAQLTFSFPPRLSSTCPPLNQFQRIIRHLDTEGMYIPSYFLHCYTKHPLGTGFRQHNKKK